MELESLEKVLEPSGVRRDDGSGEVTGVAEPGSTEIRRCRKEDIVRIAEIHRSELLAPGTLLAQLSPAALTAFYETFLDQLIFLVHSTDGQIDGFVLGGSSQAVLGCRLSFLRTHALTCLTDIASRPGLWPLAYRSLGKLFVKWFELQFNARPAQEFRLLSIAVDPTMRRRGVGSDLVQSFEAAIRKECSAYSLSVLKTNATALRFYESLGFRCVEENAMSCSLRKELAANSAASFEVVHSFSGK